MEVKNIASAFIKAKKAFAPAMKTSTNPHFKSKYADLAACVEAVDDAFLANGIVMYQETFECANGVLVETVLMHESGETIRCGKLHVPASKQDAQGYGSALSYARRYSLMAACGIAPEDDDGNAASKRTPVHTPTGAPIVDERRMSIIADVAEAVRQHMDSDDLVGAYEEASGITEPEERVALWKMLDSKTRAALKGHAEQLKKEAGFTRA